MMDLEIRLVGEAALARIQALDQILPWSMGRAWSSASSSYKAAVYHSNESLTGSQSWYIIGLTSLAYFMILLF
jgi:hypothetical protein